MNKNTATTTAPSEPYTVIGDNWIKVCAHCFPGDSILQHFPDMCGVNISHGICPAHAALMRRELALLKLAQANKAMGVHVRSMAVIRQAAATANN